MFHKKLPLKEKLNICIVAQNFPILGIPTDYGFLWPIARGLSQQGHHVTVISWKNPVQKKEIILDNIHCYFLGHTYGQQLKDFPQHALQLFNELHNKNPFQILHSIDDNGVEIAKQKKKFKIASLYDVDATHMSLLFSILGMSQETLWGLIKTAVSLSYRFVVSYLSHDRRILKTADAVFVSSPLQRVALERYFLYPDSRIYNVPHGIELMDLSPQQKSKELLDRLKIPPTSEVVLAITDMIEVGEMINLLKAFEKAVIKKPTARLVIIGDGPRRKEIEYEVYNLALGSKVILVGSIDHNAILNYISLCDVIVNLNSRTSGFEPGILAAMAQKKIIIGSELSPIATLIEDGKQGFLIRPADIHALSTLLLQIFNQEVPIDTLTENARKKVIEWFDAKKMIEATLKTYKSALMRTGLYSLN